MKKWLLQIGSLLMAFAVLFVSIGWDVKFHYCTENRHLTGGFGMVENHCLHCLDHEHDHETTETHFTRHDEIQFNAKCCCDDFDNKIQFTDSYTFSAEKHFQINLPDASFLHVNLNNESLGLQSVFSFLSQRKILTFLSGQERIVRFSNMKIDPLVF